MKVSITNTEVLNLFRALSEMKIRGNEKFVFAIAKNRTLLGRVVKKIQAEGRAYADGSERFKELQEKGNALVKQFAVDEKGKPSVRDAGNGSLQRVIPKEKMQDFTIAREQLEEEYKDVLLAGQLHEEEFQRYLRNEVEIELHALDIKNVPDEAKDTQHFNLIYVFITEGEAVPAQ